MLAGGRPCSSSPAWRILTAPRSSGASSFDPGANSGLPETACRPLLLALAHGSPSSSSPPWGHLMPPRPYGPWHKRRPAVTSVPPPAGHHSSLSGEELLPSVATWPHESDHDSTLGRGVGLAAPLAGQRSERPQKNKAHGGPVAPAQFSTEMALNDLESIGESILMVENGFVS